MTCFFSASALYYLAELVEEYTVLTEKLIKITLGVSKAFVVVFLKEV